MPLLITESGLVIVMLLFDQTCIVASVVSKVVVNKFSIWPLHKLNILSVPTLGFGLLLILINAVSLQPCIEVAISLNVPVSTVLLALLKIVLPVYQINP